MNLTKIGSNMTVLSLQKGQILFSYQTPVCFHDYRGYFRTNKKWSATTTRHINKWIDGNAWMEVDQSFLDGLIAEVK